MSLSIVYGLFLTTVASFTLFKVLGGVGLSALQCLFFHFKLLLLKEVLQQIMHSSKTVFTLPTQEMSAAMWDIFKHPIFCFVLHWPFSNLADYVTLGDILIMALTIIQEHFGARMEVRVDVSLTLTLALFSHHSSTLTIRPHWKDRGWRNGAVGL